MKNKITALAKATYEKWGFKFELRFKIELL